MQKGVALIIMFAAPILLLLLPFVVQAKEIALSFDDIPAESTQHFDSEERTKVLIAALREMSVPPTMIFANPCKVSEAVARERLNLYKSAGHLIANHTCSHPRLDDVGFDSFSQDALKGDHLLSDLFVGQKFFRFPFLNEGKLPLRDQMRVWLKANGYRNGMVSVDNDDYLISSKINEAKQQGLKIDYDKVQKIFLEHLMGAVEFYDSLAIQTLGYSPKHIVLLHERDATVMFIKPFVKELRKQGWKIISAADAFLDPLYFHSPQNTYANNGIVAQLHYEKSGNKAGYFVFDSLKAKLDKTLNLKE